MRRRTTVREHVPVGRVTWLMIALFGMVAAWLLFHYQAPGIITAVVVLYAVVMLLPDRIRRLLAWDLIL